MTSFLLVKIVPMREMTSCGSKAQPIKRFQAGVPESTRVDEPGATWVDSVPTEVEGPATIGSPPVLVDVIESSPSTFMLEYTDVEGEGPRDDIVSSGAIISRTKLKSRILKDAHGRLPLTSRIITLV